MMSLPAENWHMCAECGHQAPPRSHHCPLCRRCIADRDHHCFFTASCIGRDNRRHFVAFCTDCALGAGYAFYVAGEYMLTFHPDGGISSLVLPVAIVKWIIGWQSLNSLAMLFFAYICAMTTFGSAGIAIWQIFLIIRGQTTYDFRSRSSPCGCWVSFRNILRNVRSVCGPYWLVVFVVPWPLFKLPSDVNSTKLL